MLDEDIADVATEEQAAVEAAEIDVLIERAEREWAAAERTETARISRTFTDQPRARRAHRRADPDGPPGAARPPPPALHGRGGRMTHPTNALRVSENNSGPVLNTTTSPHRAGAPNHLEGSGENPMVGNDTAVHPAMSEDAYELDIANAELRYVVDALARCLEENERLRGELDAANDAVLELLAELDEAYDGTERGAA
jgi:hypothetical protein